MKRVVRWHRSAYESDEDLELEKSLIEAMGMEWSFWAERACPPPTLGAADVLVVTSKTRVDAQVLSQFAGDLVVALTSGVDHIDLQEAERRGIRVARSPMARRDAVVEQALGELITLMRCAPHFEGESRTGRWSRGDLIGQAPRGIAGSRIAVVGMGVIGHRMATMLQTLGAEVLAVDPFHQPEGFQYYPLEEALSGADAVTLHCALTPSSADILSKETLQLLPTHAVVVNTARGGSLDVASAVERIGEGNLRGLSVDVFPQEPYPQLASGAEQPNIRFTPHSAGYTVDLGRKVREDLLSTLRAYHAGADLPFPVLASERR